MVRDRFDATTSGSLLSPTWAGKHHKLSYIVKDVPARSVVVRDGGKASPKDNSSRARVRPATAAGAEPEREEEDEEEVAAFTPIGKGLPFKAVVESLYVGDMTRARGELLVMSYAKDREDGAEAPKSMNWWGKKVKARSHPNMSDGEVGSAVMYYSPAETARTLEIGVWLKFDYFPEEVWKAWSDATQNILKLPVLVGGLAFGPGGAAAAQAIVGVGGAISDLTVGLLNHSIDGNSGTIMGGDLTINQPGRPLAQAGFLVVTPDEYPVKSTGANGSSVMVGYTSNDGYQNSVNQGKQEKVQVEDLDFYVFRDDASLRHASDGAWRQDGKVIKKFQTGDVVEGPWPYAVISIDGEADPKLKKWKPASVSADLVSRFLAPSAKAPDLPKLTERVFSSYSDALMVKQASELAEEIDALSKEIEDASDAKVKAKLEKDKKAKERQRTGFINAIDDEKLKELIESGS
ncbi:hypothetical protein ACFQ58_10900 [Agromyces sp. NPDC056523]|uniref:hypothetical protein n=1 Tax=Agromyces sp. NPDC056523 TaxID=3345850 RepID=UPI00366E2802